MTTALEGGEGSASRLGRSLPPGKTRHPFYRRLGGPQGWSGQVRKISPPPGFDPRTVQPVASRYTDWAARPTGWMLGKDQMVLSGTGLISLPLTSSSPRIWHQTPLHTATTTLRKALNNWSAIERREWIEVIFLPYAGLLSTFISMVLLLFS